MTPWRQSSRCDSAYCVEVAFVKSTRSADTAACVEVAFVKATASAGNGNCVEVGPCCGDVLVRDSKDPDGARLSFSSASWRAFLADINAGELEYGGAQ